MILMENLPINFNRYAMRIKKLLHILVYCTATIALSIGIPLSISAKERFDPLPPAAHPAIRGNTEQVFSRPGNSTSPAIALAADSSVSTSALKNKAGHGLSAGDGIKGLSFWATPFHQYQKGFDFTSGKYTVGFESELSGGTFGVQYFIYNSLIIGASVDTGSGYAESSGALKGTSNTFNFTGVNAFVTYIHKNLSLTTEFGYNQTYNEVQRKAPAKLPIARLDADTAGENATAGIRAEYLFSTKLMDITPYAGVRLDSMRVNSFSFSYAGRKLFTAEEMNATIWQFPVGVTLSNNVPVKNSSWTIRPSLDLSVIPAAGDFGTQPDIRLPGSTASASMDSNIMDGVTGRAALAVEAYHTNGFAAGLGYCFQSSEHTVNHSAGIVFRYEF